jgi:hypothetical protein
VAAKPSPKDAPTVEQGEVIQAYRGPAIFGAPQGTSWSSFVDEQEYVPDLQFPMSLRVYHKMRSDSQLSALYRGATWPIRQYLWHIDPNGADDKIVEKLSRDYNLPIKGDERKPQGRSRDRFSWEKHLYHALLSLVYGFYYFEQNGVIEDDGLWHLKKLAPRPPQTIDAISVSKQGSLEWIKQNTDPQAKPIPIDNLVAYVWEQEGGNWYGRSMFRACYGNWLIKQRLMRVDAINVERAGAGIPYFEAPPGASPALVKELDKMAQQYKAGDKAGGAGPAGAKLRLVGVEGGQPDAWKSIRGHDEAMARDFLMMFIGLAQGSKQGSYALGQSFIDWFSIAQQVIAKWAKDIFNEHVIEDDVDWNFGEDVEICPKIGYQMDPDPNLAVMELVKLIDSGAIIVDDPLEEEIREKYNMPERDPKTSRAPVNLRPQTEHTDEAATNPPGQPSSQSQQPGDGGSPQPSSNGKPAVKARLRRLVRAEVGSLPLPDRPLRRQPYDFEAIAGVDFSSMDAEHKLALGMLVSNYQRIVEDNSQDVHDQIVAANGDSTKLIDIGVDVGSGTDLIKAVMIDMANKGATAALVEAAHQGVALEMPEIIESLNDVLQERAVIVDKTLIDTFNTVARQQVLAKTILNGQLISAAHEGPKTPAEIANAVQAHMVKSSMRYRGDRLAGAIMQAYNAGRKEVFKTGPAAKYYATEMLDENTCSACAGVDGTEYLTVADAENDYPNAGFTECAGGDRCRGTLVAIYNAEGQ